MPRWSIPFRGTQFQPRTRSKVLHGGVAIISLDGVDYAAPSGTDIVSMWGGIVVEAAYPTSFGSAFGRAVVIDHDKLPDGSPGYWGLYAHMSAENVSVGQRVEAGQKIGDVGSTGNSTGAHAHCGVYKQPSWCSCCGINPQPWIDAGVSAPPQPSSPPASGGQGVEEEDMFMVESPARGVALVGPGYYRHLGVEERDVMLHNGVRLVQGNDREFDVTVSVCLHGDATD